MPKLRTLELEKGNPDVGIGIQSPYDADANAAVQRLWAGEVACSAKTELKHEFRVFREVNTI